MKTLQYICIFIGIILTATGTLLGDFTPLEAFIYAVFFTVAALITTCQNDII